MSVVPLVINTVTMPAPANYVWDILDVLSDAPTVDALGYEHKDILAQKRWLQVRWTAVSVADMATILSTINPGPYVSLTALDPMTGASRTMTATVSKRTAPVYNETLGLYESLTCEFTETGVTYTPPTTEYLGDAVVAHVLAGETFYSDSAELLTGTMPDREGDNACTSSSVDGTTLKLVAPTGFYDGTDTVTITDDDFVAANIRAGTTVLGIEGTMEAASPPTYKIVNPASLLTVSIPAPTYP